VVVIVVVVMVVMVMVVVIVIAHDAPLNPPEASAAPASGKGGRSSRPPPHDVARQAFGARAISSARRSLRRILPTLDFGSSLRNSTSLGTL